MAESVLESEIPEVVSYFGGQGEEDAARNVSGFLDDRSYGLYLLCCIDSWGQYCCV
jgi:hypothetical protein